MNHINYFSDVGLDINITPDGNLKIKGFSSLQNDLKNQVLQYAKKNKRGIILELQTKTDVEILPDGGKKYRGLSGVWYPYKRKEK